MSNYPSPSAWAQYVSRRGVLKGGAAAGGLVALPTVLAACGDDDDSDAGSGGGGFDGSIGSASGTLKIGSRLSNPAPEAGLAAVAAAFPNENVTIEIDTTDSNTFQENINTILQAQESDIIGWFAGFRNRFFADQGLVGDISDVWDAVSAVSARASAPPRPRRTASSTSCRRPITPGPSTTTRTSSRRTAGASRPPRTRCSASPTTWPRPVSPRSAMPTTATGR